MSETPKMMEFMMMKVSASELDRARRVVFRVSALNYRELGGGPHLRFLVA